MEVELHQIPNIVKFVRTAWQVSDESLMLLAAEMHAQQFP